MIAVFSLIIFYWAVAVTMSKQKVQAAVEEVEHEAESAQEVKVAG